MKFSFNLHKICIYLLSGYVLATLLQNYYSVYVHLVLFVACILLNKKIDKKIGWVLLVGSLTCLLFVVFSIVKGTFDPITQIGIFLHYTTWPVIYLICQDKYSENDKKKLLFYLLFICIVNNILSLVVLFENREISRLLAGAASLSERQYYFGKGVGGYGHVYAMVFISLAALLWFINSRNIKEKIFLLFFLITNYLFILFSSYTTAILFALILTFFALTMKVKSYKFSIIFIISIIILLVFGQTFLNVGIDIANSLKLDFVSKHLSQILSLQYANDYLSLRRSYFYLISWESFKSNPFTGGMSAGGHSHLLDCLARMGVFGLSFYACIFYYEKQCADSKFLKPYIELYLSFFIFTCVDSCEVAQIPLILFFISPMIFSLLSHKDGIIYE